MRTRGPKPTSYTYSLPVREWGVLGCDCHIVPSIMWPRSALHAVSASMGTVIIPSFPLSIVLHSCICKNSNTSHQDGMSCVGGKYILYCTKRRVIMHIENEVLCAI
jgi:hypothetical protein